MGYFSGGELERPHLLCRRHARTAFCTQHRESGRPPDSVCVCGWCVFVSQSQRTLHVYVHTFVITQHCLQVCASKSLVVMGHMHVCMHTHTRTYRQTEKGFSLFLLFSSCWYFGLLLKICACAFRMIRGKDKRSESTFTRSHLRLCTQSQWFWYSLPCQRKDTALNESDVSSWAANKPHSNGWKQNKTKCVGDLRIGDRLCGPDNVRLEHMLTVAGVCASLRCECHHQYNLHFMGLEIDSRSILLEF